MSTITQEDRFTEDTHDRKMRKAQPIKASGSPTLPSQPKPGSSELLLGTPVFPKPSIKNSIPVILSGVNGKFEHWRSVLGALRQCHPSLKVFQIKKLPKGDSLFIGDSVQGIVISQSETKMKAVLGKNVKVSLPKAFQTNKHIPKVFR